MKVLVKDLHAFCVEALTQIGVGETDARTTADVLVTTDTWGTFTHGTKALRAYTRRLRGGGLRMNGTPRVVDEGPAWAVIDGDSSLGMVSSVFAMNTAMARRISPTRHPNCPSPRSPRRTRIRTSVGGQYS